MQARKKESDMNEEIRRIDALTMYQMIENLFQYDYFSTKCLVDLFIERRTNENEIEELKKIKHLLFKRENQQVIDKIQELIKIEKDTK